MREKDPTRESTGLNILSDDELRTHVVIMLEGHGHRGPQSWPLEGLDEEVYEEIERRLPACAELRQQMEALFDADMERRRQANPVTPSVRDYADSGQGWADESAERTWEEMRDRWRVAITRWVEEG